MSQAKNFIPSLLTTWVAWRDYYTTSEKPFNLLMEEMNTDEMPTIGEYLVAHGGECPYCRGDSIINSPDYGLVYCICELLGKLERIEQTHAQIRNPVSEAYLSEIVYPREMGEDYINEMIGAVEEVKKFIRCPEKWILLAGKVGVGKTHLLKAVNTHFDPIALYISAGRFEELTHKFRKEDGLGFFYTSLIKAPILILDDLGMEYGGQLVKSTIEKVIDARYEAYPDGLSIIATNLMSWEMGEYIPRASDRIMDKGRTVRLVVNSSRSFRMVRPETNHANS